jgi:lipopolysaccharide biosynthesis glycosyltransferase
LTKQDKLKEANVEIAKEKQKHEHTEFALKAKNTILEQQVKSLKSDYNRQSDELQAKGHILDELVEQLAPNVEC